MVEAGVKDLVIVPQLVKEETVVPILVPGAPSVGADDL